VTVVGIVLIASEIASNADRNGMIVALRESEPTRRKNWFLPFKKDLQ
jgi:hypothetical protein